MKKQVLTSLLVIVASISSYAQCNRKIVLTASSTEYLNGKSELQKTVDEVTTIKYDSTAIVVTPGDDSMEGTVNSITCDWKTPYKEGKTVIKTILKAGDGQAMTTTITIEGKDGKLIMLAEFEEMPDMKIRLTLDKFEEQK